MPERDPAVERPAVEKPAEAWYEEGLRFSCTQCGNCCTGPPGVVWFTPKEATAMARTMGLSREKFLARYARKVDRRWSLNEHKTEHGFDCVFLDRDSQPGKAICSLYDTRPSQCRTWPFWPENIISEEAWLETKESTPCPGMGRGKLVPVEEIRIQSEAR